MRLFLFVLHIRADKFRKGLAFYIILLLVDMSLEIQMWHIALVVLHPFEFLENIFILSHRDPRQWSRA